MATPKTVVPADPKHYVWWFPGSPIKVHLDLQVVQRLKQRLGNAGTGVSECGLLFGGSRDGATEILDFQPALSASVPEMVAALPTELKRRLIGYYRTEENESLHLNAQDLSLAERCFRGPNQVFLMVHANGFGPPAATFFFRDRDGRMAEFGFLEFPLDPSLLAMEEYDRVLRTRDAVVDQPVTVPAPPADDGRRIQRRSPWKTVAWLCSAALILALGLVLIGISRSGRIPALWRALTNPPATASDSVSVVQSSTHPIIALHVIRKNGDLELTWDRESPLLAAATSGLITIQDGESKRLVPLDSAQLYGGTLLYSPTSDQILMQLSLTTAAGTATESVTAILPKAVGAPVRPQPAPAPLARTAPESSPPPSDTPAVKPSKPFAAASLASHVPTPAPPVLPDPPVVRGGAAAPAVASDVVSQLPTHLPPAPVSPSRTPAPSVTTYEPPVAVVKITPTVSNEQLRRIFKRTVVRVEVSVDAAGNVTNARAIPGDGEIIPQPITNAAAAAARSWRFQPARQNQQPVASQVTVQFVFNR